MKFSYLIISLLFFLPASVLGQPTNKPAKLTTIGVHAISNINAPFYISYYNLQTSKFSFGVKSGYGWGNMEYEVYTWGSFTNFGHSKFTQHSTYFYLTPVFIPVVFQSPGKLSFFSAGFPLGYSNDNMTADHFSDPLFGVFTQTFHENQFYTGLEVEYQYWIEIGDRFVLTSGLSAGVKFTGNAPFQDQLQNANKSVTYFPGMSRGTFLNVQLGFLYQANEGKK